MGNYPDFLDKVFGFLPEHISHGEICMYDYISRQNTNVGKRMNYRFALDNFNEKYSMALIHSKKRGSEIALLSSFYSNVGREYHIPMIDFSGREVLNKLDLIERLMHSCNINHALLLDSGRSFHFYGNSLMSDRERFAFMGKLLLELGDSGILDTRWVGHRIIGDCSSLRITANTRRHKYIPKLVKEIVC